MLYYFTLFPVSLPFIDKISHPRHLVSCTEVIYETQKPRALRRVYCSRIQRARVDYINDNSCVLIGLSGSTVGRVFRSITAYWKKKIGWQALTTIINVQIGRSLEVLLNEYSLSEEKGSRRVKITGGAEEI